MTRRFVLFQPPRSQPLANVLEHLGCKGVRIGHATLFGCAKTVTANPLPVPCSRAKVPLALVLWLCQRLGMLREAIKRSGKRQVEIAAAIAVSPASLSNYIAGRQVIPAERAAALADMLGIPRSALRPDLWPEEARA